MAIGVLQKMRNFKIEKSILEKWYFLATYILAVIAIFGFIFSIWSTNQTSKTLETLEKSLSLFTEPLIIFDGISWFSELDVMTDCNNPPIGINAKYRNRSNIPVRIVQPKLILYWGDILITPKSASDVNNLKESIVPAGEFLGMTEIGVSSFKQYLKNKRNIYNPPFLKLHFTATISNVNETKIYKVDLIHNIGIDCKTFDLQNITKIQELFEPLK